MDRSDVKESIDCEKEAKMIIEKFLEKSNYKKEMKRETHDGARRPWEEYKEE